MKHKSLMWRELKSPVYCRGTKLPSWERLCNLNYMSEAWLSSRPSASQILSQSWILSIRASQTVVPGPPAAAASGNLLEMSIIRPHSRPTESKTLGAGPSNLGFNQPCRWCWRLRSMSLAWPMTDDAWDTEPCINEDMCWTALNWSQELTRA